MKRYWLFEFYTFYPAGGFNDFVASFDTVEEARKAMEAGATSQIFDSKNQTFVKTGDLVDDIEIKHVIEKIKNDRSDISG